MWHLFAVRVSYAEKQKIREMLARDTTPKVVKSNNADSAEHDQAVAGGPSTFIGCNELKSRMDSSPAEMLLVDCRPAEEYANSSISYKNAINIPSNKIALG